MDVGHHVVPKLAFVLMRLREVDCIGVGLQLGNLLIRNRKPEFLFRLGQGDLAPFRARLAAVALTEHPDGRMIVDDPDYGVVEFNPDGSVTAEGRTLNPARWTIRGTRTELEDFQGRIP